MKRWTNGLRFDRLDRVGKVVLVIAVALAIAGATSIGYALARQHGAPEPRSATRGPSAPPATATPSTHPSESRRTPGTEPPARDTPAPAALRIPAIGVTSRVQALGLNADNTVKAPPRGPRYDQAAWYKYSRTPGNRGTSIIQGHVDSAEGGPSVFFRLGDLRRGDRVTVTRSDHSKATFVVDNVRRYAKRNFPTRAVYQHTENASLRLVTCGGAFNRGTGRYQDNIIAFAHLTKITHR